MARQSIDTAAVHAGEPEPRINGAVEMPIFQSANYLHEGTDDYFATRYVRLNNSPNHHVLHAKLATLEHAEAALVTASGMAAISTALFSVLAAGDHLLMVDCPYGGTRSFVTEELARFGIESTFIDGNDPARWEAVRRPRTRAIYVESITNPLMTVPDLVAVVDFARRHGLVSLIDNTIATPVNFRPAEHGFDLSLHSATKYLNGHSDVAAGAIIGRAALIETAARMLSHFGGCLDPHACFLLQRGLKTLPLRVRRQSASALALAEMLDAHPAVAAVHYPGLRSTPGHAYAREVYEGFGGMLSFELVGGVPAAERLVERLTIALHAASLGGTETLIVRPSVTAYASVAPEERRRLGVTDGLLRLSVGIEDPGELADDLRQGLDAVASTAA
ncbi:MAG: PLP-dependent aspartate aminotransferase family protein [Phycisphaerae bacterium]|nr:PLP-dependent aspartate aminotransferase family protein [Phycisphaerae bacterium]NNF43915.1 PLP-dependent transferase [Phycisphaerales bacterium]